jgi:hypothetical protein
MARMRPVLVPVTGFSWASVDLRPNMQAVESEHVFTHEGGTQLLKTHRTLTNFMALRLSNYTVQLRLFRLVSMAREATGFDHLIANEMVEP